jgi:hypothetical protein
VQDGPSRVPRQEQDEDQIRCSTRSREGEWGVRPVAAARRGVSRGTGFPRPGFSRAGFPRPCSEVVVWTLALELGSGLGSRLCDLGRVT